MLVALNDGNLTLISELSTGGRAVHAEVGELQTEGAQRVHVHKQTEGNPMEL